MKTFEVLSTSVVFMADAFFWATTLIVRVYCVILYMCTHTHADMHIRAYQFTMCF